MTDNRTLDKEMVIRSKDYYIDPKYHIFIRAAPFWTRLSPHYSGHFKLYMDRKDSSPLIIGHTNVYSGPNVFKVAKKTNSPACRCSLNYLEAVWNQYSKNYRLTTSDTKTV